MRERFKASQGEPLEIGKTQESKERLSEESLEKCRELSQRMVKRAMERLAITTSNNSPSEIPRSKWRFIKPIQGTELVRDWGRCAPDGSIEIAPHLDEEHAVTVGIHEVIHSFGGSNEGSSHEPKLSNIEPKGTVHTDAPIVGGFHTLYLGKRSARPRDMHRGMNEGATHSLTMRIIEEDFDEIAKIFPALTRERVLAAAQQAYASDREMLGQIINGITKTAAAGRKVTDEAHRSLFDVSAKKEFLHEVDRVFGEGATIVLQKARGGGHENFFGDDPARAQVQLVGKFFDEERTEDDRIRCAEGVLSPVEYSLFLRARYLQTLRTKITAWSQLNDDALGDVPFSEVNEVYDRFQDMMNADRRARLEKSIGRAAALYSEYRDQGGKSELIEEVLTARGFSLDFFLRNDEQTLLRYSGLSIQFNSERVQSRVKQIVPNFAKEMDSKQRDLEYARLTMLSASLVFGAEKKSTPNNKTTYYGKAKLFEEAHLVLERIQKLRGR